MSEFKLNWQLIAVPVFLLSVVFLYMGGRYFFDGTSPDFRFETIRDGGWYKGEFSFVLSGSDNYGCGDISAFLDGKVLVDRDRVRGKSFDYHFAIDTANLSDGKHDLKVVLRDSSRNRNQKSKQLNFFVDNVPLKVSLIGKNDFRVLQGRTLKIRFRSNKELKKARLQVFSRSYPVVRASEEDFIYESYVPVACEDEAREGVFKVLTEDFVGNKGIILNKFKIDNASFKAKTLLVSQEQVQECEKNELDDLEKKLAELTKKSPKKKLWRGLFYVPIENKGITTEFGTLRTSREKGRYRHAALDLKGDPKSVVWASQNGVVVIKDNFKFSGKTVVLDHGCGIFSLYFHLNEFAKVLKVGDEVKRGRPVGTLGKTGYATGYHLHWEMRVDNTSVDPMQWTEKF